ncbi:CoA ester lyase [Proteiniclasticum sp. QWL-01]|uniref:HpcH/HpaI aldolase/citrate lyase family protein n=1 Tax=Proteiniclasticum sp. QWL-01 TaxID=3036945 RepID=UPI0022052ECC|nr:CoA ester lyase [Proteiniclasticum sp. QWL-01]UUM11844.1 CoA ester lyase [Clostridiaceae bacterium HFYG-1003]WFF73336.1 CoA ester lyase [Proteiniclasticum sp. QWL-01]
MKGLRRSFQFVPANNPGMLMSADILGADSIIFDLEDAVALTEKDAARGLLREALQVFDYSAIEVVVRINPPDSGFCRADIQALAGTKVDAILVPKATVETMSQVLPWLDEIGYAGSILALIESALGVEQAYELTRLDSRIDGVLLGGEDLTSDLGVIRTKAGNEINYARTRVVSACKAAKITCIDTPWTDAEDLEGLARDTEYARSIGFNAKSSINPRHLPVIHQVFAPKGKEIQYALRVMEAMELAAQEGKGVFSLDGKMVDAPIIARARQTLELAEALNLVKEGEYCGN